MDMDLPRGARTEFAIRPAISDDIPELIALDHSYNTDHVWQMSLSVADDQVEASFREIRLPRAMRVTYPRDPQRLSDHWTNFAGLLVVDNGERCVAYATLLEGTAPQAVWATDLVVDPRFRRQGLATRLVMAGRAWTQERGYQRLMLECQSKNFPAIALARKLRCAFAGYSDRYYPDEEIALFWELDTVS